MFNEVVKCSTCRCPFAVVLGWERRVLFFSSSNCSLRSLPLLACLLDNARELLLEPAQLTESQSPKLLFFPNRTYKPHQSKIPGNLGYQPMCWEKTGVNLNAKAQKKQTRKVVCHLKSCQMCRWNEWTTVGNRNVYIHSCKKTVYANVNTNSVSYMMYIFMHKDIHIHISAYRHWKWFANKVLSGAFCGRGV